MIGFETLEQRQLLAVDLLAGLRHTEPRSTTIARFEPLEDGSLLLFSDNVGVWQVGPDGTVGKQSAEPFGPTSGQTRRGSDPTTRLGNRLLHYSQVFDIDTATTYELPVSLSRRSAFQDRQSPYFSDPDREVAYFIPTAPRNDDNALWQTDGTIVGTKQVATLPPHSVAKILGALPSALIYLSRMMISGTTAATWSVNRLDIPSGEITTLLDADSGNVHGIGRMGSQISFIVERVDQPNLLVFSDGTPEGTRELQALREDLRFARVVGDLLFYFDGREEQFELFVSNGSAFATGPAEELLGIPGNVSPFRIERVADGFVYVAGPRSQETIEFVGDDGEHRLLGAFEPTNATSQSNAVAFRTDSPDSIEHATRMTAARGNSLRIHKVGESVIIERPGTVFVTDGTFDGSKFYDNRSLGLSTEPVGILGDKIIALPREADADGREPWITDGTESGTRLLADLNPGHQEISVNVTHLTVVGDNAFFSSNSEALAASPVWFSLNGQVARPITDLSDHIDPASRLLQMERHEHFALFQLRPADQSQTTTWFASDGTVAGTRRLLQTTREVSVELRVDDDWFVSARGEGLYRTDPIGPPELVVAGQTAAWLLNDEIVVSQYLSSTATQDESERGPWKYRYLNGELLPLADIPLGYSRLVDNQLFMLEQTPTGAVIWASNGKREGTAAVARLPNTPRRVLRLDNTLFYDFNGHGLLFDTQTFEFTPVSGLSTDEITRSTLAFDAAGDQLVSTHCQLAAGSFHSLAVETVVTYYGHDGERISDVSFDGCLSSHSVVGNGIYFNSRDDATLVTAAGSVLHFRSVSNVLEQSDDRLIFQDWLSTVITDGTHEGTYRIEQAGAIGNNSSFSGALLREDLTPAFDPNGDGQLNVADIDALFQANEGHQIARMLEDYFWTRHGDTNLDGRVDFADFLMLASNYGKQSTWAGGDLNGTGSVDHVDFEILASQFG